MEIRTVRASELDAFRRLHNACVDRDEPLETIRAWYRDRPELLIGAYLDGELVGHCLGCPHSEVQLRLAGIGVKVPYQRQGIGSSLLTSFEERASRLGFERISLGSAGGYVDEFYVGHGYTPTSVLVRMGPEETIRDELRERFDIVESRIESGASKCYIAVDGYDPASLAEVQEAFDDPQAIYIMEKVIPSP